MAHTGFCKAQADPGEDQVDISEVPNAGEAQPQPKEESGPTLSRPWPLAAFFASRHELREEDEEHRGPDLPKHTIETCDCET